MREKIAKNFYRDEFECKCGCGFDSVDAMLVHGLQRLRDIMQAPVHINSGCRCAAHNATLDNSSTKSQHVLGKAADIRVSGYTPEETLDFARAEGQAEAWRTLDMARTVAKVVGYQGEVTFDTSKPDGAPRKLMDSARLNSQGWHARVTLEDGLARAYADFLAAQK